MKHTQQTSKPEKTDTVNLPEKDQPKETLTCTDGEARLSPMNQFRMRIFVDLDGVLADLRKQFKNYAENGFGWKIVQDNGWELHQWFDKGYTSKERWQMAGDIMAAPGFWPTMEPLSGAVEAMEMLYQKHDVYIATSLFWDKINPAKDKLKWVRKHLPFVDRNRLCCLHDKGVLCGSLLIDDNPNNCTDFAEGRTGGGAFLFGQTWNRDADITTNVLRVKGWEEILKHIEKMSMVFNDVREYIKRLKG